MLLQKQQTDSRPDKGELSPVRPKCSTCDGLGLLVRTKPTNLYRSGFVREAYRCPDCKPTDTPLECMHCHQKGHVSSVGPVHADGFLYCNNGRNTRFQAVRA